MDDSTLLRQYVSDRSEVAFSELVRRHVNLVYGAALRQTGGDAALASDVTQLVFVDLARKAVGLTDRRVLSGWLYTSTRFVAAKARRSEGRRLAREREAFLMQAIEQDPADWERLRPLIDDALHSLGEVDREAVLLRFFEGRGFGEIGAMLQLNEDAARKRVERALARMSVALSRHGITSTSSALALALARHAVPAAPAGLASSAAQAALGAAAVATGTAWSVFGLAPALKISVGTLAGIGVLVASLAGNGWLLLRTQKTDTASVSLREPAVAKAEPAVTRVVATDLAGDDLAAVRDRLRAGGLTEAAVRSTLEALLRRRYRDKLSERHADRYLNAWWKLPELRQGVNGRPVPPDDAVLLRDMVTEPLKNLLGVDPLEEDETAARYGYLPAELRRPMMELNEELRLATSLRGQAQADGTADELEQQRKRIEQARDQLVAGLPDAQRREFELRHAAFATSVMKRMELIDGTEAEYRTVFAVIDQHAKELAQLPARDALAARQNLERGAAQQLVATLGFERAVDYIWSGVWEFSSYARVAREAGLPVSAPGKVFQLAAETATRAGDIHYDPALDVAQKHAALAALQQTVRPAFDTLFPPPLQQRLPPEALAWVNGLGEGKYRSITTTIQGNPGSILTMGGAAVGPTPEAKYRRVQLLPQRHAGP